MDTRFFVADSVPAITPGYLEAAAAAAAVAAGAPLHDPPLAPRDEAVFLLTAAAEIEQALMVQYLFAAYSVHPAGTQEDALQQVQDRIVQIAREEMGHLMTVQNLLRLVGGPLQLGRDSTGDTASVAPFTLTLEPLTTGSLAKYVTAESPGDVPDDFPEKDLLKQIGDEAIAANGGLPVHHVGVIFDRLKMLFAELSDDDLQIDTAASHGRFADWGYKPHRRGVGEELIVLDFPDTDPSALRTAAIDAVTAIGAQGEGFDVPVDDTESHFERFFALYKLVREMSDAGVTMTWPVVTNPNTTPAGGSGAMQQALDDAAGAGRITEARARAWAQLFDLRYRLLLGLLLHFLHRDDPLYSAEPAPAVGDRTERGLLLIWTFDEMRHLGKIADLLVRLPKDPGGAVNAGPPFELPYTVQLPDSEKLRWRTHLDVSRAADALISATLQPPGTAPTDPFLDDVLVRDAAVQATLESLAKGNGLPADALPTGFVKAVTVLEEAVRGFRIGGPHLHFWADTKRDAFLDVDVANQGPPIGKKPDGTPDPDPANSLLITRITTDTDVEPRMPRDRPAIPDERVEYLRSWIRNGSPAGSDADAIVHQERSPMLPAQPEPSPGAPVPGFAADVRPLFRDKDRNSMKSRFDLFDYDQVKTNATAILGVLTDGAMPCDGPWPPERVAVFSAWVGGGMRP